MKFLKTIGAMAGAIAAMVVFVLVIEVSLEREAARQDAVRAHNCKHYGEAINAYVGKDVCPPTPHG